MDFMDESDRLYQQTIVEPLMVIFTKTKNFRDLLASSPSVSPIDSAISGVTIADVLDQLQKDIWTTRNNSLVLARRHDVQS